MNWDAYVCGCVCVGNRVCVGMPRCACTCVVYVRVTCVVKHSCVTRFDDRSGVVVTRIESDMVIIL